MLLQFRINNVKSFREEAIIDFLAASIDEHKDHLYVKNGNPVLPLVSIYGANAAGKTNVLTAFAEMCDFIKNSVNYSDSLRKDFFFFSSFIYDTKKYKAPLEFEVTLALDLDYRYGFTVTEDSVIVSEYLEFRKSPNGTFLKIFERNAGEKVQIGKSSIITKEERKQLLFFVDFIRDNDLLLTMLGRRQKNSIASPFARYAKIYEWFMNVQSCPECNLHNNIISAPEGTPLFEIFSNNEALDAFLKFVQIADPTIRNLSLEIEDEAENNNRKARKLLTHRHLIDLDENSGHISIPTFLDSSGTKYLMQSYPIIRQTLQTGGLLIADEIDRSLHPSLLLNVINLFTNPETNPYHAQLLCTMHNVIIMDRRFMRRDEIWFVEKNSLGESTVYSLADYNDVRNDADFCKNYILGKYGAIPEK